jgi:hypothetical protein
MERFSLPAQLLTSFSRLEHGFVSNDSTIVTPTKNRQVSPVPNRYVTVCARACASYSHFDGIDRVWTRNASWRLESRAKLSELIGSVRRLVRERQRGDREPSGRSRMSSADYWLSEFCRICPVTNLPYHDS